jgi:hypothetical protein
MDSETENLLLLGLKRQDDRIPRLMELFDYAQPTSVEALRYPDALSLAHDAVYFRLIVLKEKAPSEKRQGMDAEAAVFESINNRRHELHLRAADQWATLTAPSVPVTRDFDELAQSSENENIGDKHLNASSPRGKLQHLHVKTILIIERHRLPQREK